MSSGIETNKIVGAILTALLVTVGIGHFGAALFDSGGHGEAGVAYPVAAGTASEEPETEEEVVESVLPLMADAAPDRGEALFGACRGCHTVTEGGPNTVGPNLWGVVGSEIAAHEGYSYSDALLALEGDWTYDALSGFLHAPRDFAPGTKMTYAGMPQIEDRANLIAYLRTLSNDPVALPSQEEIDAAAPDQQAAADGDEAGGDEADEDGTAEDGDSADAAPEDAAGDEAAPDEAAPEDAADDEAAPEETAGPDEAAAGDDADTEDAAPTDGDESEGAPEEEPAPEDEQPDDADADANDG